MKVILDIKDNRVPFFMELIRSLDYIRVLQEIKDERKGEHIQDIVEAFNDVKLFEQGGKQLKNAKDLIQKMNK